MNKDVGKAAVQPQNVTNGNNGVYVRRLQGIPVQPGQDMTHTTLDQRLHWFANHENRWKQSFSKGTAQIAGQMNWTRG